MNSFLITLNVLEVSSIEGIFTSPLDSPFWNNTMRPPCNWFLPSTVSILKSVLSKWKWMNLSFSKNGNRSMPLGLTFKVLMTEFANEVSICKARLLKILIPFSLSRSTTLLLRLQCRIVNAFAITNLFSFSLSRSTTLLLRLQCRIVNAFAITNLFSFSLSRSTTLLLRLQCRIVNAFAITNLFSLSDEILKSWSLSCFIWKCDFVIYIYVDAHENICLFNEFRRFSCSFDISLFDPLHTHLISEKSSAGISSSDNWKSFPKFNDFFF